METIKLKLRYFGDPCLRKKSVPVKSIGPRERILIAAMIDKLHEKQGVGLAAPQVGVNEQIFVMDVGEGPIAVINPKIVKRKGSEPLEEGCLCMPGVIVNVRRPNWVRVKYVNEKNQTVECDLSGLLAKVYQHERDHLFGKLIIDRASWKERIRYRQQLKRLRELSKSQTELATEEIVYAERHSPPTLV